MKRITLLLATATTLAFCTACEGLTPQERAALFNTGLSAGQRFIDSKLPPAATNQK